MSMSEEYQPINCDDYDNLELACQHHLILTLKLRGGEIVEGKASDLLLKKKGRVPDCRARRDNARIASGPYRQLQSPRNWNGRSERIIVSTSL